MAQKTKRPSRTERAPRIRVPNNERALFQINEQRFVGVIQRLSLSGGSAVLSRGPIPEGTMAEMALSTVHGKIHAHVEFLHTCADGIPLAQAFRFLAMDDVSSGRFAAAAQQMHEEGFSDAPVAEKPALSMPASEALGQLLHSVRRIAATIVTARGAGKN